MRIPFGNLKVGDLARANIAKVLDSGHLTEGPLTAEFERLYAAKFGWKQAIATSSGTTAGEVVWSAIGNSWNNDPNYTPFVATPACAFVATANCLLAARIVPYFIDVDLSTINIDLVKLNDYKDNIGIQFVATMGRLLPLKEISEFADAKDLWLIGDLCEAHGATLDGEYPNKYLDAAIYSLYPAHLVVGVEGGVICTDNDELADLCRSIKSHGRPTGSNFFDFQRIGYNAKWSDLHAAVALESLARFDQTFSERRRVRSQLLQALTPYEDNLILYRNGRGEIIAPHAFCITLRDEKADIMPLYRHMEANGIECKKTFGSLPTQHKVFEWMGHSSFP